MTTSKRDAILFDFVKMVARRISREEAAARLAVRKKRGIVKRVEGIPCIGPEEAP